jgi:hypothetical protein
MRSAMIAAIASLATLSAAFAQTDQAAPSQYPQANRQAPAREPGITTQQETTIPYHPCTEAYGWVNGRLRCNNRY